MKKHANVAVFIPHAGCPHDCSFCNQRSISGTLSAPTPEIAENEIRKGLEMLGNKAKNAQIAFFGGSFTAIDNEYRTALLKAARPYIGNGAFAGIRISTRPDYIDEKILEQLKYYKVNAIELGVQSMDEEVLNANNRGHSAEDVYKASSLIKSYGFSLGHQMMTGLYKSTEEKEMLTAKKLAEIKPNTMRIYPTLTIKGTRLAELYENGEYIPALLENAVGVCAKLLELFTDKAIDVIRLGLHNDESLCSEIIAGPYHPAFRELCENKIMLKKVIVQINEKAIPKGDINIHVAVGAVSKMTGQKRANIEKLRNIGYNAKIMQSEKLAYLQVDIVKPLF